jgi:predicted transposase/invertase (TIGR01784 family)
VRTDALFYELFQTSPSLLFELLGLDVSLASTYRLRSIEVKQTAFRLDGVLLSDRNEQPLYFLECQFQKDRQFYLRLFGQIALYLRREQYTGDWCAVALFARRSLDPGVPLAYRAFETCGQVQRLYVQEQAQAGSLAMTVLQLVNCPRSRMRSQVAALVERVSGEGGSESQKRQIMEWVETIVVSKFPHLSVEEIAEMLKMESLRRTRVFQEALQEGQAEGLKAGRAEGLEAGKQAQAVAMNLRLLQHRLGALSPDVVERVGQLPLPVLDNLSLALLEFDSEAQVRNWLTQHA